jgi:hypothetical protein
MTEGRGICLRNQTPPVSAAFSMGTALIFFSVFLILTGIVVLMKKGENGD